VREGESDDWLVWDTTGQTAAAVPLAAGASLFPQSAFRYAQRTREPLLVEDAVRDDRFTRDPYLNGLKRCSLLIVPILRRGTLRAVLVLENRRRRGAFAASGLNAVTLVTGQLTVSLDNAQLYASLEGKVAQRTTALAERTAALEDANRQLESLSNTDALTDLPNRRRFDTTLDAEWRRAGRQGAPLGLAMIDVDHFKRYNDRYGHPTGDECLRTIATALRAGLRGEPDIVCRYGGEEFAAILPGTDELGCLLVAERMRAAVVGLRRPHDGSDLGLVSVSIGVAAHFSVGAAAVSDLVAAADAALYAAKLNGRNRVWPGA
jgi:diguanylate cyclase (GGDEF)-like protein